SHPISPHDFAMRPSQAKAIRDADVLFYVGETLEPWLVNTLRARTEDTIAVRLGDIPDLNLFDARELDEFDAHDEKHTEEYDPHYWLDPENALKWLAAIAERLETVDQTNTAIYRTNLERAQREVTTASNVTTAMLSVMTDTKLIITHDSIQYFERAFGLSAVGAFAASDGQRAGARSLNALLNQIGPDTCIVEDITHPSRITDSLPKGIRHVTVDPMGYDQLGEGYYPRLLNTLAQALLGCRD
ncbi:MAG: zinc ABC transporter substrate-binding protein, partial [Paracoccaceae bacterium]